MKRNAFASLHHLRDSILNGTEAQRRFWAVRPILSVVGGLHQVAHIQETCGARCGDAWTPDITEGTPGLVPWPVLLGAHRPCVPGWPGDSPGASGVN